VRFTVDPVKCSGHGRCYTVAPRVYSSDDEGYNSERGVALPVPDGLEDEALAGAAGCPERAIQIED
jgi:ferredoxin